MDEIDIKSIKNINVSANNTIISFEDYKNEYSFNLSKSTLYKRFITKNVLIEIDVEIIEEPYQLLKQLILGTESKLKFEDIKEERDYVVLPLFSDQGGRNVPKKSGLNQWNAGGRKRQSDEIYIPIPSWIHKVFPEFFPDRDTTFELILPDGQNLKSKVCQQGNKALMSNPNIALGKWLLRDVMKLEEWELLTYERLEILGLDSIIIYKNKDGSYSLDFTEIGKFDEFEEINKK